MPDDNMSDGLIVIRGKDGEMFFTPFFLLSVKIVNPSHGLDISDFSKISLGCGKICMSQNYFTYDFNGCSGSAGIGGCMPS